MSKITFIIPSIGRDTLQRTIETLENQTNSNWNAIIIFDGCSPTIQTYNTKIKIIQIEKLGKDSNSAGLVRNEGIKLVDTEWVAFVDDDDTLANNYVETFYNELLEIEEKQIDVIIFRMYHPYIVYPLLETDNFYCCNVGISFAMKTRIYDDIQFIPSSMEDYLLLDRIRENKYKMMISPFVRYFVRDILSNEEKEDYINNKIIGNRVFIN
jgi:glycosyltransferase involved in cell wall biosynthesis